MGELKLYLLGAFRLEGADGSAVRLATRKTRGLLAYLALQSGLAQPRPKLATLFWEDSSESQARESLRQTLTLLRKALPAQALVARDDAIVLAPTALDVDALRFEGLVGEGEPGRLDEAARLYRGELLEGFDLPGAAFESWLTAERQRLHEKALAALSALLAQHVASGALERGVAIATRLIAVDPLRESAHRTLMELFCRQGRQADAIRQYQHCADLLRKELGVEPDAATKALHHDIRAQRNRQPAASTPSQQAVAQDKPIEPPLVSPAALLERRQVTILACDLVGLSDMAMHGDPESIRRVMAACRNACAEIVSQLGGTIGRFSGDGLTAYFGYPRAHEGGPERAVRAGLALVQRVPQVVDPPGAVRARIGIATGAAVLGNLAEVGDQPDLAAVGEAPKLAAALQSVAPLDGIAVAAATRELLRDLFEYRALEPLRVAGSPGPVPAWQIVAERGGTSRFEALHRGGMTSLVGREAQIELLLERWRVARSGLGRIVLITGEPGIGKSRLAHALQQELEGEPREGLHYQCSPFHTNSALHPFVRQLERTAGFEARDGAAQKLDKVETMLIAATPRGNEMARLVAPLLSIATDRYPPLGLSPPQQRRKTLAALLDLIEAFARRNPLLLVFEDAHWADATSLELLDLAAERIRRLPVLALMTFRPGFVPAWSSLDHVDEVPLSRLQPLQARTMIDEIVADRGLPGEVVGHIAAKTDGIPLFVEELTKAMLEAGMSAGAGAGDRPHGTLPLPATLHDSVLARLDRLSHIKDVFQAGAAIGREFPYALLRAVVPSEDSTLRAALGELEEAELVFRRGEPPDPVYTFKHALVQDAAYASLPTIGRTALHQRIADVLRDRFPALAQTEPEVVAHHLTRAGLAEAAIEWWGKAGERAMLGSAYEEAIAHLREALRLAETLADEPRRRPALLRLQTAYGYALLHCRGTGSLEMTNAFLEARRIATGVEDASERFSIYWGLWIGSFARSELAEMRRVVDEFQRDAERSPESPEAYVARRISGVTSWFEGDYGAARLHLERALAASDRAQRQDIASRFGYDARVFARLGLALVLWPTGEVARARELVEAALPLAKQIGNIPSIANALLYGCVFETVRGEPGPTDRYARELLALAEEHRLPLFLASAKVARGWAQWRAGDRDAATGMRDGLRMLQDLNVQLFRPLRYAVLAEVEARLGHIDEALAILDHELATIEQTGERWLHAEILRSRAEILRLRGEHDERVERDLLAAITVARSQGTRTFELRAALSLAKFHDATGRHRDRRGLLASLLTDFASGCELPELVEARQLVVSLAGDPPP